MNHESSRLNSRRLDLMAVGLVALACLLTSLAQGDDKESVAPTAASLMQTAHDGRAVWREFPGFTVRIKASSDGVCRVGCVHQFVIAVGAAHSTVVLSL